jgi:hypothetical protein
VIHDKIYIDNYSDMLLENLSLTKFKNNLFYISENKMPHSLKEIHLEELCCSCKHPVGSNQVILHQHHKIYEIVLCQNCGYEIIRLKDEKTFHNKFEFI